jgi:hypothetical protein
MTGHDFVTRILALTKNDVGPLIELCGGYETEWLEFKAAILPRNGSYADDENEGDYRWHVAIALIAMANSTGGALLIGVSETKELATPASPIDLSTSGFFGDKDEFARRLQEQIISPSRGWRTKCKGIWTCKQYPEQFSIGWGSFLGATVAIIFVKPIEKGGKKLWLHHTRNNQTRAVFISRTQGAIGKNHEETSPDDVEDWWLSRVIDRPMLDEQFRSFEESWRTQEACSKLDAARESSIADYAKLAIVSITKNDVDKLFTPLEGEAHQDLRLMRDFFEPQAEEAFDPWNEELEENSSSLEIAAGEQRSCLNEEHEESQSTHDDSFSQQPRSGGVFDLIEEQHHSVLLGEPGSGKTWCLQHIQLEWAVGYRPGNSLTIYVPLNRFKGDLWELCAKATALSVSQLHALADEKRLKFLLDGLNECPPAFLDACNRQILGLRRAYPSLPIVLTSRPQAYKGCLKAPIYVVKAMSHDIQLRFLIRRLGNESTAVDLLQRLREQPGGDSIASNPFLLKLVAELGSDLTLALPLFPAQLHRLFFDQWYRREEIKALKAGTSLEWNRERCREILALLAFRSRLDGQMVGFAASWATPHIEQEAEWQADKFLLWAAQGLLLSADSENHFLQFRHETLQESLAAEYLIAHPDQWQNIEPGSSEWRMTAAHALSLGEDVSRADLCNLLLRIDSTEHRLRLTNCLGIGSGSSDLPKDFYALKRWFDAAHRIGLAVALRHTDLKSNFLSRIYSPNQASFFVSHHLLCRDDFLDKQDLWVRIANATMAASWIREGLMLPDDFASRRKEWASTLPPRSCALMIQVGILRRSHISKRLDRWIANAPPEKLAVLTEMGLVGKEEVKFDKDLCVKLASPWQAASLVNCGIMSRSNFESRIDEWVRTATCEQAVAWLQNGLLTPEDVLARISDWVANATPWQARLLVDLGLASLEDFSNSRQTWLKNAMLSDAIVWIDDGLIKPDELKGLGSKWKENATLETARLLIEYEFAEPQDFLPQIPIWLSNNPTDALVEILASGEFAFGRFRNQVSFISPEFAKKLIDAGLAKREEFLEFHRRWIENKSPKQLANLVLTGVLDVKDISENPAELLSRTSAKKILSLFAHGALTVDELLGQANRPDFALVYASLLKDPGLQPEEMLRLKEQITRNIGPIEAVQLFNSGVITRNDLAARLSQWEMSCKVSHAAALVKAGLLPTHAFLSQHAFWLQEFHSTRPLSPPTAMALFEIGVLDWTETFPLILGDPKNLSLLLASNWLTEEERALARQFIIEQSKWSAAIHLVEDGTFRRDDFSSRIGKWMTREDLAKLIAAGWIDTNSSAEIREAQ